jgi:hypothetical protein
MKLYPKILNREQPHGVSPPGTINDFYETVDVNSFYGIQEYLVGLGVIAASDVVEIPDEILLRRGIKRQEHMESVPEYNNF